MRQLLNYGSVKKLNSHYLAIKIEVGYSFVFLEITKIDTEKENDQFRHFAPFYRIQPFSFLFCLLILLPILNLTYRHVFQSFREPGNNDKLCPSMRFYGTNTV